MGHFLKVPRIVGLPRLARSGFFPLQPLHVRLEGLLDRVSGDEADKVLDVGIPVCQQVVHSRLPQGGFGDLAGVG